MKLALVLNHRCNLRCSYCYTGEKFNRPMSPATARQAVDFGFDRVGKGLLDLTFFGGEPMLELGQMEAIVPYARAEARRRGARVSFHLSTNGTVLSERHLKLMTENAFSVQVSLDGSRQAQDAGRRYRNGRSSMEAAEQNLERLLATGMPLRVVSVITPENSGWLGESLEHLVSLGARNLYFSPNYLGNWDEPARERFEAGLLALGERMLFHFRRGCDLRVDPLNGKIITHLLEGSGRPIAQCGFGCDELAIAPSGRIYPCDRLVNQDDNEELCIGDLERGLDLKKRNALRRSKARVEPKCRDCELRERCSHWCGCANYETTGSVARSSDLICYFEGAFIGEADRVANLLFEENNPAFLRRFYLPLVPMLQRTS